MHKITRLICLQLFACKLANIRKPRCCNTGPDRDAVDDDNEHPRKDAHCHHLQLRIRVGNGRKREGRQSGSRSWSVSMACPGLLDIDCVSHVTCVRLTHASYQSTEDNRVYVVCTFALAKDIDKVTPPTHLVISSQLPNPTPWGPVTCF